MEFTEHDTAFDPAGDAHVDGVDSMTADHDSTLGGTDDHYSMIANNGDGSDGSDGYGDSSNTGQSASYGDDSSSSGYGDDGSSSDGSGSDGTDGTTETSGSAGTVSIMVDGHTYTEPGEIDSEGYNEAQFQLPDGDTVIAADADHDGQADIAVVENPSGQVIDQQHVDPTSGQWIDDGPGGSGSGGGDSTSGDSTSGGDSYPSDTSSSDGSDGYPSDGSDGGDSSSSDGTDGSPTDGGDSSDGSDTTAAATGTVHVSVNGQTYDATEQYDVNQDGHADSGVVEVDGKTYLLTDFNGDGTADHVEVGEDGQWKSGYSISADGQFTPDAGTTPDESDLPGGGEGFAQDSDYAVDPQTGEWTTQ